MPPKRSKSLQVGEIENLLQELGQEITACGFTTPIRIMLLGGAYMLLTIGNRPTTTDIDLFPLNFEAISGSNQTTSMIFQAIASIANRHELRDDWCNFEVGKIAGWKIGAVKNPIFWQKYGVLEVFLPPADFMLAAKIFSYRDKDLPDVLALIDRLQVKTRVQAQVLLDQYIDQAAQQERQTDIALDELFDE